MSENINLIKSLKGRFNNYLLENEKLKTVIDLALNIRCSDIYITEWKTIQYKKNWIINLTEDMIPNESTLKANVTHQDFQDFLKCILTAEEDIDILINTLNELKSFDYWIWYKFTHTKPINKDWEKPEIVTEDIRLRLNFINTVNWIMLTIRPLLNIGLTYDKLTSLEWAINLWKKLISDINDDPFKQRKEEALSKIKDMERISKIIKSDFSRSSWLILVTWSTWEWKSTLVTSLIEDILENTDKHILTLEDPIEYIFKPVRGKVTQIEIGSHIESFSSWIRGSKRENPDIVYIQEIRDKQSAQALIELLWSGVLVITTLHTWSVSETIDRLIWLMSEETNQEYIRTYISRQLISIINQKLIYINNNWKIVTKWVQEYLHLSSGTRKNIINNEINQLESGLLESNPPNKSMTKLLWYFYVLWIIPITDLLQNITNIGTLEALLKDEIKYVKPSDIDELLVFLGVNKIDDLKF